jgi:hypothetical protein
MPQDDVIGRLARQIDAAKRSENLLVNADDVTALRRRGAAALHATSAEFVASVNSRLSAVTLELSPSDFRPEAFRQPGVNLFQIASQGRQMQITFEAPRDLVSTDKFLIPYVLEGEVRTYNQRMLDHFEIRSYALYFCIEQDDAIWRFFDWRTRRTGPVTRDLLASLMEPLF